MIEVAQAALTGTADRTHAWSISLHKTMRSCQRRAAFSYVVASPVAKDDLRRRAYLAKQLQEVSNWQGHLVHDVMANEFIAQIRANRRPSLAQLVDAADRLIDAQLAFSRAHRFRSRQVTKTEAGRAYCALALHERGEDLDAEALAKTRVTLREAFAFILGEADFMRCLRAGRNHQAEVTLWFLLGGSNVRATIDLIFSGQDGLLYIVDWKLARSLTSDYSHQLRLYALAAMHSGRWSNVDPASIRLMEANLLQRRIIHHSLTAEQLTATEDYAYRGIVELRELMGRGRYEDLHLDELDVATTPKMCSYCSFSDICIETLMAAGRAEDAKVVQGLLL